MSDPAFAIGGWFAVDALTVTGVLGQESVVHDELRGVRAGPVGRERGIHRGRARQRGGASRRLGEQWTMRRSGLAHPGRSSRCRRAARAAAARECWSGLAVAAATGLTLVLVTVSVCGKLLPCPSLTMSCATKLAGRVGRGSRCDRGRRRQRPRQFAGGTADQRPRIRQRVAVDVGRRAAVERDHAADVHAAIDVRARGAARLADWPPAAYCRW